MIQSPQKRDANEREIINALRKIGAVVLQMDKSAGFDLLVAWHGVTYVMEVKQRGEDLTEQERKVADEINKQSAYLIVHDLIEALDCLGALWE